MSRASLAGFAAAVIGSAFAVSSNAQQASSLQSTSNSPASLRDVETTERILTIGTLKGVKPLPRDTAEYIVDKLAAQQLGKAMFWDTQVGSSGLACASCHFHAGADIRTKNQVNPGLKAGDSKFNARADGGAGAPNASFTKSDFPFHRLANSNDRDSAVLFDTNDVFSSQGSLGGSYVSNRTPTIGSGSDRDNVVERGRRAAILAKLSGVIPGASSPSSYNETCNIPYDPVNDPFHRNNLIYRKVEPRQTPTMVNAVFNVRQFWDGRANAQFNGINPFGPRVFAVPASAAADAPGNPFAARAGTVVLGASGKLQLEQRLIDNASLASQAVGPALSDFEMSCASKSFADLGRKLIPLQPLAKQRVEASDSLFGQTPGLVNRDRRGLLTSYSSLIRKAFNPKFWAAEGRLAVTDTGSIVASPTGFSQMELNFSLFWGLAVQEYESLLISDDSPYDRYESGDKAAISEEAKAGLFIFQNKGSCVGCHSGPLLSSATAILPVPGAHDQGNPKVIEHMRSGDGATVFYDAGYYNIGVRPTADDIGVGAADPFNFDLSYTRQMKWARSGTPAKSRDKFDPTPCKWVLQFWPCAEIPIWPDAASTDRDGVDGAFKVPTLRNVGLNPPYFHNGGQATLKDVVRFYNRGGDRRGPVNQDTTGVATPTAFGQTNVSNLAPDVGESDPEIPELKNSRGLTEAEMDAVVEFLLSLSDDRVACHAGVFDHPELPLQMGQEDVAVPGTQIARDIIRVLPAVGRGGLRSIGKACFPNSGDLFGSLNKRDPRPLQATFDQILDYPASSTGRNPSTVAAGGTGGTSGSTGIGRRAAFLLASATAGGTTTTTGATPGTTPTGGQPGAGGNGRPAGVDGYAPPPVPATAPIPPAPKFSTDISDIHGFTIVGFIQKATVSDADCPELKKFPRQWGGTATLNGTTVTIPCNTILQMPASTFTWAELFNKANGGVGTVDVALTLPDSGSSGSKTGAFAYPSTEITILGNIVAGRYIAGMVYMSQQSLNTGTGFITGFDYANGVIYVGNGPTGPAKVRLQLNDAKGRFSKGQSPDPRFNLDDANPTIRAASGYPMCVPRVDPTTGADDILCPQRNRPKVGPAGCRPFRDAGVVFRLGFDFARPYPGQVYCAGFVMPDPAKALPGEPIATQQAPFEVGDFITYSGTLLDGDTQGPDGSATISGHTIVASLGIFTQPGTLPSYIAIGEFRISTFTPTPILNGVVQELQDRLVLEAFTTDVTSIVDIYLVDLDPKTGDETQRWVTPVEMTGGVGAVGSTGGLITGGITTQITGPVPGRVRLRANLAPAGLLNSPTRYMRVAMRSLCDPGNINGQAPLVTAAGTGALTTCLQRVPAANGLYAGQFLAPVADFILPENLLPGDRLVPNNFWDLNFLASGEGPGTGPPIPTPW